MRSIEKIKEIEKLAERLHIWYLEVTKKINPKSFNPNAQKEYSKLTEEQKFIDKYISEKILEELEQREKEILEDEIKWLNYLRQIRMNNQILKKIQNRIKKLEEQIKVKGD